MDSLKNTGLELPPYSSLMQYESRGNYAIKKYYTWPYSMFYKHKLKMILSLMDRPYYDNIMDFGSGPGIFIPTLRKRSVHVFSYEPEKALNPYWRFELIICASVLEFIPDLNNTCKDLASMLKEDGKLIVASPMKTPLARVYFKLIKDRKERHDHIKIVSTLWKYLKLEEYEKWLGLYFVARFRKQ